MTQELSNFRKFIAGGQWTSSWAIVVYTFGTLLGLRADFSPLSVFFWVLVSLVAGFLVVSMAISWRIPGWPRVIAIVVEVFILLCGVALGHHRLESSKVDAVEQNLLKMRESTVYRSIQVELEAALKNFQTLSATEFDQDHYTAQGKNEGPKSEAARRASESRSKLLDLEDEARRAPVVSAGTAFDIFGQEWSSWLEFAALVLFAVGNEGLALALTHPKYSSRGAAPPQSVSSVAETSPALQSQVHPTGDPRGAVDQGQLANLVPQVSDNSDGRKKSNLPRPVDRSTDNSSSKSIVTFDEYQRVFDAAVSEGLPHGYRVIMKTLGISEPQARQYASMVKKNRSAGMDQSS